MLVDEIANLVDVALGEDPSLVDQQDVRRHRLDLVQDVARDDDALAGAAPVLDHADRLAPRDRIHARQRLVEDQQLRIVRERLRHLDPLAHALAVGADLLVGRLGELDVLDRARAPSPRASRLGDAVQTHERRHPFKAGHPIVEGVLLGTEADAVVQAGFCQIGSPRTRDAAFARLELPGDELHERRLARAVRPEQAGDAGRDRDRDVVQADDLAVPLRQVIGDDQTAPSRDHLDAADAALENHARQRDQPDDHQQRDRPRRVVARRLAEDHVADLRQVGRERQPRTARCCASPRRARRRPPG